MKIRVNPNREIVDALRAALKQTGGYCPCEIFKNDDTKCMCRDFRDQISKGIPGECHCGLYEGVKDDD
jgi:ferredoxin-thioredoxin reductase catalytic subunit